ncbi:MAG: carbohydrate ABC transporter permease [Spirochaetaceae bacterium]|jgi:putative aldouronate transport system permease protein|nr:carbohydrate ABC transporter permease [Spirochaetaceae bacterium]
MIEKIGPSRITFNILNYAFMVFFALICIAPLWHVLMASLSNPRLLFSNSGIIWWPLGKATLEGYALVFQNSSVITGYRNTFFYLAVNTVAGTALTVIAGFVLSRPQLKLKKFFTLFIMFTMMFSGGLIPSYMVNRAFGLVNNVWGNILPGLINAFYIILMMSAFSQLPSSYEESAKLDGASPLRIMVQILVPLVKATIAVIVMFIVVQQWNSWFQASIYLSRRRDLWPLQLFMREILVQNDATRIVTGSDAANAANNVANLVKYAVTIVGTLPILCAYPFAQKYFVKGVTLGGIKG